MLSDDRDIAMDWPMGESRYTYILTMGCHAMAMNICGVCGSENAYIATKWCSVMNLVTKCGENGSLW